MTIGFYAIDDMLYYYDIDPAYDMLLDGLDKITLSKSNFNCHELYKKNHLSLLK